MRSAYALSALALIFAACSSDDPQFEEGTCSVDSDCPVGFTCRADGLCICINDESCADGEFCNRQGLCQESPGCRSNTDCPGQFCDIFTGDCIELTACGADNHCVHGQVCNRAAKACEDGCFDEGDCPLYSVCDRTGATSTTTPGRCISGRCADNSYCNFGERCIGGMCIRDTNPNHCASCNNMPGDCGGTQNYCLINVNYDPANPAAGGPYYCGVECAGSQDCPYGYQCGPIILLTQDLCTSPNDCGGGGRQCIINEGDVRGNCTCANDADCNTVLERAAPPSCQMTCGGLGLTPCTTDAECLTTCQGSCQWPIGQACTQDAECQDLPLCAPLGPGMNVCVTDGITPCSTGADCLCASGLCANTGRPCSTPNDCMLTCQGGGCFLGAACGPLEGLSCQDVR